MKRLHNWDNYVVTLKYASIAQYSMRYDVIVSLKLIELHFNRENINSELDASSCWLYLHSDINVILSYALGSSARKIVSCGLRRTRERYRKGYHKDSSPDLFMSEEATPLLNLDANADTTWESCHWELFIIPTSLTAALQDPTSQIWVTNNIEVGIKTFSNIKLIP